MGRLSLVFASLILTTLICEIYSLGSSCSGELKRGKQSEFWQVKVKHEEMAATNPNPTGYKVYRNVKDFGAKGDGVTDDTNAINEAISSGNRCGEGCDSSTLSPAIVYIPPGKYLISKSILQYYFTEIIGDPLDLPTLIMAPSFSGGLGLLESDKYGAGGKEIWTNQNNFYRQVRNLIIDTTKKAANAEVHGMHWQVAQATSITNVHFKMPTGSNHHGIWMENGSGGWLSDLTFEGGKFGLWVGNQQFTSRNIKVSHADTAIYMNWNWGWTFKNLDIRNCKIGLDMTAGGEAKQGVHSVLIMDSEVHDTDMLVKTATSPTSKPHSSGSLVLDNIKLVNVKNAVQHSSGKAILAGGSKTIESWAQGPVYGATKNTFLQDVLPAPAKPAALLDSKSANKIFFERTKPTYVDVAAADFVSVKSEGAKGDGKADDTKAIQAAISKYAGCKVIYFPTGQYLVSDTILVPAGSRLVGEVWSTISATGKAFSDANNPKPLLKLGNPGDTGVAELSDLVISDHGPVPGAILVEINIKDPAGQQGVVGLWDVHFRVGGAKGTEEQSFNCQKMGPLNKPECFGAFLMLHVAPTGSAYLENVWAWVADHDLDGNSQITLYNGRGVLIESRDGPVWGYGTASEHSVFYQYNIVNAKNVILGMIQTETPYYQPEPPAPKPFTPNAKYNDPDFSNCAAGSKTCPAAWGLRIKKSSDIFVYGAGLYNFFMNYDQGCLTGEHCQDSIVSIEDSPSKVYLYNLNTKASESMVDVNHKSEVAQKDNHGTFVSTIAAYVLK